MLSVVILTMNEEKNIADCIASVRGFADEALVFDSGSKDRTVEIAGAAGARVETRPFDNYAAQRNASMEAAKGDWIFFIDADERANEQVGKEICETIARVKQDNSDAVLFWIPRRNHIFGKWIQHTGWSPDYQPRLMKKGRAHFDPARPVHELVLAQGSEGRLTQPLVHYNYETLEQFKNKQKKYTRFEAEMMFAEGIHPRLRSIASVPAREFGRRFVTLEGYRDGVHGLVLSGLMSYYAFQRQRILAEMWRDKE